MEMRVRACVLAVVLVVLGASSVFAQNNQTVTAGSPNNSWLVGAPAGSVYASANNFNLALNREGNRELGAPVSICAGTPGGASSVPIPPAVPTANARDTFNVGDVFTIEYKTLSDGANPDPVLATTGALGGTNVFVIQNGVAGTAVTATASAAMVQPAIIAGATVIPPPQAMVTVTITGAPTAASGINCISIQGLRFDLGNTKVSATLGPLGVDASALVIATVTETSLNGSAAGSAGFPAALAVPLALPNTDAFALGGNTFGGVNGGFPQSPTNVVGTAFATLGSTSLGLPGIANPTGLVTGGLSFTASANTKTGFAGVAPSATVGGTAKTGAISIQQNPIPSNTPVTGGICVGQTGGLLQTCAGLSAAINLPIQDGGGMFRGFVATGPDTTTWLNAALATSGTGVQFTVSGMPTGSSVVFPASVTSASPGVVWTMAGGGTVSAPGGSVTYTTTVNEGPSTALGVNGTTNIGPSMDISFTVTPGTASTFIGASVVISVVPAAGASSVPTYSPINGVDVIPSQAVGASSPIVLFNVNSNQSTRTFPYVTFTGGTTPTDYDTGIALTNTGRGVSVVTGASCFTVPAGGTVPAACGPPFGGTVSTNGTNSGQDGPFTIFLVSSGTTVASVRSTAANFPNAATYLTSAGNLIQGTTWVALLSQITAAAGITGKWSGELVIVSDFPSSSGFAFISQFTNPGGGATMGYKVTNITGEN